MAADVEEHDESPPALGEVLARTAELGLVEIVNGVEGDEQAKVRMTEDGRQVLWEMLVLLRSIRSNADDTADVATVLFRNLFE